MAKRRFVTFDSLKGLGVRVVLKKITSVSRIDASGRAEGITAERRCRVKLSCASYLTDACIRVQVVCAVRLRPWRSVIFQGGRAVTTLALLLE